MARWCATATRPLRDAHVARSQALRRRSFRPKQFLRYLLDEVLQVGPCLAVQSSDCVQVPPEVHPRTLPRQAHPWLSHCELFRRRAAG